MKSLQEQMLDEIEALRKDMAPDIPDFAMTFEGLMDKLGNKASRNRLHAWLVSEVKAGRWKKPRTSGSKSTVMYWKSG